jgi:hypothetical protein
VWKIADVPPVPKAKNITDFNKDLRSISLTSTLSKIAENIIIEYELKSKLLRKMDPMRFGFIPGSNTTLACSDLITRFHTPHGQERFACVYIYMADRQDS